MKTTSIILGMLLLPLASAQTSSHADKLMPVEHLDAFASAVDSYKLSVNYLFTAVASGNKTDVGDAWTEVFTDSGKVHHTALFVKKDAKKIKNDQELFGAYRTLVRDLKILTNAQVCMSAAASQAVADSDQMTRFIACSNVFMDSFTKVNGDIDDLRTLLQIQTVHVLQIVLKSYTPLK